MSTLSLPGNVVFAIVCALGLVASLAMPWYGTAPTADEASIEHFFATVQQVFTGPGVSGADALGMAGSGLLALAGAMAASALLCLVRTLESFARPMLTLSSTGALGLSVVKVFDQPGANVGVDLRYGVFVAVVAAGLALCAAGAISAKPSLRKRPARMVDMHTAS